MPPPANRFLVMVRAGDRSLHRDWVNGSRNWDLVVSWYGSEDYVPVADERVLSAKGWKWDRLASHFEACPELLEAYDYFWFPDDDLETTAEQINRLFEVTAAHGLAVSQPALTPSSYVTFVHTLQCRSFLLRYTDFVECMAPCLSRETLRRALPYFAASPSGYALDTLWSRFEDDNRHRAAVIDVASVRHTRPVGSVLVNAMNRDGIDAYADGNALLARFGASWPAFEFHAYAGLSLSGRRRGRVATAAHMLRDLVAARREWVQPDLRSRLHQVFSYAHYSPDLGKLEERPIPGGP